MRLVVLIGVVVMLLGSSVGYVAWQRETSAAGAFLETHWPPSASAYSRAFTDAVWMQTERRLPMEIDRTALVLPNLFAPDPDAGPSGFMLMSVAATALVEERHGERAPISDAARLWHLGALIEALRQRASPDDLAAIYGEQTVFAPHIVGIASASQQLFGKPPALLLPHEAALLVHLAWTRNPCDTRRLTRNRDELVARMAKVALTDATAEGQLLGVTNLVLGSLCAR